MFHDAKHRLTEFGIQLVPHSHAAKAHEANAGDAAGASGGTAPISTTALGLTRSSRPHTTMETQHASREPTLAEANQFLVQALPSPVAELTSLVPAHESVSPEAVMNLE